MVDVDRKMVAFHRSMVVSKRNIVGYDWKLVLSHRKMVTFCRKVLALIGKWWF
jgi:hypothetical protein